MNPIIDAPKNEDLSVGSEVELLAIDAVTGELIPDATWLIKYLAQQETETVVEAEITKSSVELHTRGGVAPDAIASVSEGMIARSATEAKKKGVLLAPVPVALLKPLDLRDSEGQRRVFGHRGNEKKYRGYALKVATEEQLQTIASVASLHFHVGLPNVSDDQLVQIAAQHQSFLPALEALAGNSVTNLERLWVAAATSRHLAWETMPTSVNFPDVRTLTDYEAFVTDQVIQAELDPDDPVARTKIYMPIRINTTFRTLETRIFDTPFSPTHLRYFAALMPGIAATLADFEHPRRRAVADLMTSGVSVALHKAARNGIGTIRNPKPVRNPFTWELEPHTKVMDEISHFVRPALEHHGVSEQFAHDSEVIAKCGTGAQHQIALLREGHVFLKKRSKPGSEHDYPFRAFLDGKQRLTPTEARLHHLLVGNLAHLELDDVQARKEVTQSTMNAFCEHGLNVAEPAGIVRTTLSRGLTSP